MHGIAWEMKKTELQRELEDLTRAVSMRPLVRTPKPWLLEDGPRGAGGTEFGGVEDFSEVGVWEVNRGRQVRGGE